MAATAGASQPAWTIPEEISRSRTWQAQGHPVPSKQAAGLTEEKVAGSR